MSAAVRALDGLAAALGLGAVALAAGGGGRIGPIALTRPEDLVVAAALVVGVRLLVRPEAPPALRPGRLVAAATLGYVAGMSFIAVTRHLTFRTHALDLGYYVQVVWGVAQGRGALVTLPPMHAWGDHFSPVLYLLAPLAWLAPGAPALLVAQTAILAAGVPAVYAFASHRLGARAPAAALAALYALNPSLHGMNIRDIHPAVFVVPFLLAAALAFDRGWRLGWLLALVLTLACREDAALAVVGFGGWLALARGRWALGAAVAAASLAVLAFDVYVLIPAFRGEPYPHLTRYPHLGGSLGELAITLATHPDRWVATLADLRKLRYLAALLAPLGLLPLLAPRALAAALPGLAMNLLSLDPRTFHHRSQYQAFVLPFLFLAAVEGYRWLAARPRRLTVGGRRLPAAVLTVAFLASVVLTARTFNDLAVKAWWPDAGHRALARMVASIPPAAPVSANERVVPHLATRPEVYEFPGGLSLAEWILERESEAPRVPAGRFEAVAREAGWVLWRRAGVTVSPRRRWRRSGGRPGPRPRARACGAGRAPRTSVAASSPPPARTPRKSPCGVPAPRAPRPGAGPPPPGAPACGRNGTRRAA